MIGDIMVGVITLALMISVLWAAAWIMTREVNGKDLDDEL